MRIWESGVSSDAEREYFSRMRRERNRCRDMQLLERSEFFESDYELGACWANAFGNDIVGAVLAQFDSPASEKLYAIANPDVEIAVRFGMDSVLSDLGVREDTCPVMSLLASPPVQRCAA